MVFILCIVTSCEGRITPSKALKESVEKFKSTSTVEFFNYYPENYLEVKTDTVFKNGFRIQLRTYSNMEKSVSYISESNGIYFETLYRQFESELCITYGNSSIYKNIINKTLLNSYLDDVIDDNYILKGAWVNDELSTFTKSIIIHIQYCKINSDDCQSFNIQITKDAQLEVLSLKDYML